MRKRSTRSTGQRSLARCQHAWHYGGDRNLIKLAVRLLFAIANAHAFQDGNKRTGFYAAIIFLEANGYTVPNLDTDKLADWIIEVIEGRGSEELFFYRFSEDIELA